MISSAHAQAMSYLPSVAGAPTPNNPAALITYIFLFSLSVVGLAAFVAFLIGAVRYFASAGDPGASQDGKDRMIHALLGMVVFVFAIISLYTINPDFLKIRNPGITKLSIDTAAITGTCEFTSAQWAGSGAPGQQVGLVATTANCPDGSTVTFRVTSGGGGTLATILSSLTGGRATASWVVPQNPAGTAYYFEVVLGPAIMSSTELNVGDKGGGEPFSAACGNTAVAGPPPATCAAPCQNTVSVPAFAASCQDYILRAAQTYKISAALIVAVMRNECPTGNPACRSTVAAKACGSFGGGACGLMQVNPCFVLDTTAETKACKSILGDGSEDPAKACDNMIQNPDMAIDTGACLLAIYQRNAARRKSENNYPGNEIQYAAAAYNAGPGANAPSCNCRNSGDTVLPAGCKDATSKVCKNCFTTVPKWLCPFDAPNNTCQMNTGYDQTLPYAANVAASFDYYIGCTEWR